MLPLSLSLSLIKQEKNYLKITPDCNKRKTNSFSTAIVVIGARARHDFAAQIPYGPHLLQEAAIRKKSLITVIVA